MRTKAAGHDKKPDALFAVLIIQCRISSLCKSAGNNLGSGINHLIPKLIYR